MAEVAALNELPVYDFRRPDGMAEVTIDAMSGLLPGEYTTTTVTELVRTDVQPNENDRLHRELAIEAESGRIWQEGCGDFETGEPTASPDPSASPAPALQVYLDLDGWEEHHPEWDESNREWIELWTGREDGAQRHAARPVPGTDRRAARADRGVHAGRVPDVHPDAVAVADAHADADPDRRRRRRSRASPRSRRRRRRRSPRARRPSPRRRPRPCGRRAPIARGDAPPAPRAPRAAMRRCRCRGRSRPRRGRRAARRRDAR